MRRGRNGFRAQAHFGDGVKGNIQARAWVRHKVDEHSALAIGIVGTIGRRFSDAEDTAPNC